MMKTRFFAACFMTITSVGFFADVRAEEPGKLIFSDDFERNESQELKDEVGNGWGTNSKSRAGGNKQVDLKHADLHSRDGRSRRLGDSPNGIS
jgi:hypothetical protein